MNQSVEFTHLVLSKWNHLGNFSDSDFSFGKCGKCLEGLFRKFVRYEKKFISMVKILIRWRAYLKKFDDFIAFLLFEEKRVGSI